MCFHKHIRRGAALLCVFGLLLYSLTGTAYAEETAEEKQACAAALILRMSEQVSSSTMQDVGRGLRARLDAKGYTEAVIEQKDAERLRIVIPSISESVEEIQDWLTVCPQILFLDADGNTVLSNSDIRDVREECGPIYPGGFEENYIAFSFTREGIERFRSATERAAAAEPPNNIIAIVLDGEIISAPTVTQAIESDECIVHGSFTAEDTKNLASTIKFGLLPVTLQCEEVSIGALDQITGDLFRADGKSVFAGRLNTVVEVLQRFGSLLRSLFAIRE